jgi:NADH-quinone oxidoreductase subunit F
MEIKTPVSATLSPEQISAIQDAASRHKAIKGGVLPALHEVQGICGNWLPLEALKLVSEGMDISYAYLYGVMSFYTMFSPTPRGKFIIRMCESPPCHILGADNLLEVLQGELGIKVGETTTDGLFTLEHTACLGVCEVSPAMQINEVVFGRLTPERIKNIVADYRAGKVVDYRTLPRTTNPLSDYAASGDELVLLANVDRIDPLSLDAYLERAATRA